MKALGQANIDELLRLSEEYKYEGEDEGRTSPVYRNDNNRLLRFHEKLSAQQRLMLIAQEQWSGLEIISLTRLNVFIAAASTFRDWVRDEIEGTASGSDFVAAADDDLERQVLFFNLNKEYLRACIVEVSLSVDKLTELTRPRIHDDGLHFHGVDLRSLDVDAVAVTDFQPFSMDWTNYPTPLMATSKHKAALGRILEDEWHNLHRAVAEFICPFCLYAVPSQTVSADKKWQ